MTRCADGDSPPVDLDTVRRGLPETAVAHWRAVAAARGDGIAILTPEASIGFAEALAHTEDRARAIAAITDVDRPVAVDTESDVDSVLALLSVLMSGRPVIMLDPLLPDDRREHILHLSGAVRMSPALINELPSSAHPLADPSPDDPAIVIFTSGSTGKPKGVIHSQRGWVNQAVDGREFMGLGQADRAAVLLPLSFGAGFDCLIMTLLNGATMMLWDARRRTTTGLRDWLGATGATTLHCTPSLLRSWLPELDDTSPNSVRLASTCGEPVTAADVALLRRTVLRHGVFCSWSGSSEMGDLAFNRFPPERDLPSGPIPVGTPASNKRVRIVGEDGDDLPAGTAGEIVVESAYLALGYLNDPDLTARRFVALDDGRTRLHTGDLGRFDDAGHLHLLGRRDDAVKIRGYLVEPIEVEAALRALPWTVEAVVTGDRDAGRLIAHVAVDREKWSPSPAEIRIALAKTLAPWMIRRDVVVMTELPRTERGKVDRAALPPVPERGDLVGPQGPTEAMLTLLWQDTLGVERVGRDEDFISLGGDSLAARTMLADLEHRFGVRLDTAMLSAAPTIAEFARVLDAANDERARTATGNTLVQLRTGAGDPIFVIAGAGSLATSLTPLARALDTERPVYGIQARGIEGRCRTDHSIAAAARRAIADIRSVQPGGPYRLCGYSMGGFIAIEAAAALTRAGHACKQVIVLDPLIDPILADRLVGREIGGLRRLRAELATLTADHAVLPDRSATAAASTRTRFLQAWNLLAMNVLMITAGLVRLPTTLQWTVFFDLGTRMIRRYRPSGYGGPIHIIRARTNSDDPALWAHVTSGEVTFTDVAGDHHSMVRAPYVTETATAFDKALSDVAAGSPS
ncbi:alpha/beta fold hydrolase [Gordonia sp. NPDC003950]